MQQLYFVRHGNADYRNDSITHNGKMQVKELSGILDIYLPNGLDSILVSSPSGRAMQTAEGLISMLSRKSGRNVHITKENALDQIQSMGFTESVRQNGRNNVALLEKYKKSEYGIFVSHDKIIVATSVAIAEYANIEIPEFLKIEKDIDLNMVGWVMQEYKLTREKAEENVRKYVSRPLPEIPTIAEASAIHIDLIAKKMEYIFR